MKYTVLKTGSYYYPAYMPPNGNWVFFDQGFGAPRKFRTKRDALKWVEQFREEGPKGEIVHAPRGNGGTQR